MKNDYVDLTAITQIIGCVFNDANILDETDKYVIHEDDFVNEFHKILFGSMYNLHLTGSAITIDAIIDYLSHRPKYDAIFQQNKGAEYLAEASRIAQPEAFNYYYSRVKKFSLLRGYAGLGLNLTSLYDPNNVLDTKLRQKQEDWLDNTSLIEIAHEIDRKIEDVKLKYIEDDYGEEYQAGDNIEDLIKSFEVAPEIGIPLYGPLINTVTRGARLRKFYLRSAATNLGKAIPNSAIIPTPKGDKRVDEIKVGDYLFDASGQPTEVLGVYPQGACQIWEIIFQDGRKIKCSKDHLWSFYKNSEHKKLYTLSTEEIYNLGKDKQYKISNNYGYRIPLCQPLNYEKKKYSLPPYILGLILGNGSFRYSSSNKKFSFGAEDEYLPSLIGKYLNADIKQYKNHKGEWSFEWNDRKYHGHKNVWVEEILEDYPALWNCKSEDKFIPYEYQNGSIEQRYELLQGLFDADGHIDKKNGTLVYTTVSIKLKNDILKLLYSLGYKASYTAQKRDKSTCYYIRVWCSYQDKHKFFQLPKKKTLALEFQNEEQKQKGIYQDLPIKEIIPTDNYTEMTCFYVDNPNHLFIMDQGCCTHNTRTLVADACNFACNRIYHEQFGWIKNNGQEPTLFISTEQDKAEIQTMMLAFLSNVNESHILDGQYQEGERERVFEAGKILKDSPIWIEELPDFSIQDVENKIKKNIREHNVKYVLKEKKRAV